MTDTKMFAVTGQGTLLLDQQIPDTVNGGLHPQAFDVYIPSGVTITNVVVACHGGTGFKWSIAQHLFVNLAPEEPTATEVNWALLISLGCMLICPQGGHCTKNAPGFGGPFNPNSVETETPDRPQGIPTWSNWCMWSQADDIAFLKDLAAWIFHTYGPLIRILAGHSNGGMITQRAWYDIPTSFDAFCPVSGPASNHFLSFPTLPSVIKPMRVQFGALDTTVGIFNAGFYNTPWVQNPQHASLADVTHPVIWIGDWIQLQARVNAYNSYKLLAPQTINSVDAVITPGRTGTISTWTYSNGRMQSVLLSQAGHQLVQQQQVSGDLVLPAWVLFGVTHHSG